MKPNRTLVIGDQHGALKAVKQVLENCKFNPQQDLLINLGDIVDGWSESSELVQFYIEFSEECKFRPVFIRGNHDVFCQEWLNDGVPKTNWLMQGGKSTVESYINTGYITEKSHLKFFKSMKDFYLDEENRAFVHAGFTSPKGLGNELEFKTYYWDRTLWDLANEKTRQMNLESEMDIFNVHKEVYIGHTPTLIQGETIPIKKYNIWNIDTGAAYTGKITIINIETKEFWQSDIVQDLYPNENGRN